MTDLRDRLRAPSERAVRSAGQVAIALTVALLGFLLAIQLRAQEGLADRLAIESESDLGRILGELQTRSDQLVEEIVNLRVRLEESTGSAAQERLLLESARAELRSLEMLLGIVPVRGPGIVIVIADEKGTVGPEVVLDAVQELRDAGAEAIEVGGVRVVASTSFTGRDGAIQVDHRTVRFPLEIRAIGEPDTLLSAMQIPGGVEDAIATRPGATVRTEKRDAVSIASVAKRPRFDVARPRR